ncbi:MAG TPA: hypothetical protein VLF18_01185 [Tahibacter sp.]|uniref:hypothetical protein n=1 Tax=Tahibacter sp. TaxID=2056211 RepID=UPI002C17D5B9|nr:hypothetical protein [Tahibacter sp.]HSX58789.1 hypothetical protein [Tahibacter sp.]
MSYENLDRIADAFVPARGIAALLLILVHLFARRFGVAGKLFAYSRSGSRWPTA